MVLDHSPYFVYIVECADGTLYTGITLDIKRRIDQHNGLVLGGSKYARSRRPVSLVYSEKFLSRKEASKREFEIKAITRSEKKELIVGASKEDLLSAI